jgi:hypothetical protein
LTVAAGCTVARACAASAAAPSTTAPRPLRYLFVNKTGRWTDQQCFWSLSDGREWHSFAEHPNIVCPTGNGRVYFRLGPAPRNFDDRETYWDFIEYACANGTWSGNTTQVDAFCIPLTIEMGAKKVGITESREKLFEAFRKECPKEFRGCVKADRWILSPARAGFDQAGLQGHYFDKYVEEIWTLYATKKPTPSGKYIGQVVDGALRFSPIVGGKSYVCTGKPSTQDILLGQGVLSANAAFCAAFNRHVAADPADWNTPSRFYKAEPFNAYAKFFHDHSVDQKAYGFCYDDFADQAAYFTGKGDDVLVTLHWSR